MPITLTLYFIFIFIIKCNAINAQSRVAVFGASGGTGQQICRSLLSNNMKVRAISRNVKKIKEFPLLNGCEFVSADARDISSIKTAIYDCDHIVISVGTTAFPTSKWNGGNTPQVACYQTVENILNVIKDNAMKPQKVVLLTSIGVERSDQFPFKILNSYGVLSEKRKSEILLLNVAKEIGFKAIICRPGRLVGAPFTNFDLAKLLNIDQGSKKGIAISNEDVLNGDVERRDVALSISKLIICDLPNQNNIYSVVNVEGESPSESEWNSLLSLFKVKSGLL
jgi:nucleoside-diphosphate-sugar epimerase